MPGNRIVAVAGLSLCALLAPACARGESFSEVIAQAQPKMAKIYGAGGLSGLEAYQSGFLISDQGHVLTAWSYVLDTDYITVTLDDGRRFQGELVGADPRLEIAILKIDADNLDYFNLDEAVKLGVGDRVLAFSNLYGVANGDEPASVLHGSVSAAWSLAARRGVYETPYRGPVYVLDAMTNNPGAAGGALTDRRGRLAGILGKELKNSQNNTWLNYGVPVEQLLESVKSLLENRPPPRGEDPDKVDKPEQPHQLARLGLQLVPNVLPKTPPFVDRVASGSAAELSGIRPDDLIVFVNGRITGAVVDVEEELSFVDRIDALRLTVQRGQELKEFSLTDNAP